MSSDRDHESKVLTETDFSKMIISILFYFRSMMGTDYQTKRALNAYRSSAAPTYSSSSARGPTRSCDGTMSHHQVSVKTH